MVALATTALPTTAAGPGGTTAARKLLFGPALIGTAAEFVGLTSTLTALIPLLLAAVLTSPLPRLRQ